METIVQSLYNTTREKIEEHAKSISNMEKWRLAAEEKVSLQPHRVRRQLNEPRPTPLFLSKGQGLEIGN